MAFFSKKEVVVASPMQGTLTHKGVPAAGAVITRHLRWKDEEGVTDTTTADQDGHFSLPAIADSWRPLLPAELVVLQDIIVEYRGQKFKIWIGSKREEHEWSELGGKPVNMVCELTEEIRRVEVSRGLLGTNCRWERIEVR